MEPQKPRLNEFSENEQAGNRRKIPNKSRMFLPPSTRSLTSDGSKLMFSEAPLCLEYLPFNQLADACQLETGTQYSGMVLAAKSGVTCERRISLSE